MDKKYKEVPDFLKDKLIDASLTDYRNLVSQGTVSSKAAQKAAIKKTIGTALLGVLTTVLFGGYAVSVGGGYEPCAFAIKDNSFHVVNGYINKKTTKEEIQARVKTLTPADVAGLQYGKKNKSLIVTTTAGEELIFTIYAKADPIFYEDVITALGGLKELPQIADPARVSK
jgi:hypothetical protein